MIMGVPLRYEKGVWVAEFYSSFGMMEVIVGGSRDGADASNIAALEVAAPTLDDAIMRVYRRLGLRRWLYRPIRVVVNDQDRIGIQFRNMFSGWQGEILFISEP